MKMLKKEGRKEGRKEGETDYRDEQEGRTEKSEWEVRTKRQKG